jgi:hypothetical protein
MKADLRVEDSTITDDASNPEQENLEKGNLYPFGEPCRGVSHDSREQRPDVPTRLPKRMLLP